MCKVDGPKASGTGKSINMFVDFRLSAGPLMGKEVTVAFSTGTKNAGPLGDTTWMPMGAIANVQAAITGKPAEVGQIDTDTLMDKDLVLDVELQTIDGKIVSVIRDFLPPGAEKQASNPF